MRNPYSARIDEEGRLVLPPELRKMWGIEPGTRLRIEPAGDTLRVRPPLHTLRRVYIELTNQCNLNCSTCMRNVWNVQYGNLAAGTYERILMDLESFSPKPEIFFGGYGEPLAHPECLGMLAEAKARGFRASMITNGILLTGEVARRLIEMGLDMLWVSLDGASPECYTDVRLGNGLPEILQNLRRLRSLQYQEAWTSPSPTKPNLGIAFVAMQRNVHDLPQVIRLGIQLGATEFSVSNVLAHNESLRAESLYERTLDRVGGRKVKHWKPLIHIPRMDINGKTGEVLTSLLKGDQRIALFGSELDENGNRCPFVGRGSLSIRWDGKISPCLPLLYTHTQFLENRERVSKEYFVGDINESNLKDIWNAPDYQALRERLEDFDFSPCVNCNSCDMVDQNLEDCFGNVHPTCGACLWAQGLIRCP